MKKFIYIIFPFITGCITINQTDTHGVAKDVGTETPTTEVQVDPDPAVKALNPIDSLLGGK